MDAEEQDEINRAFEARGLSGFEMGGRLLYYQEEYEDAKKGLIDFPPEKISKDDTVSMSARGLAWSTQIRYLKAQKEYFRYRAIIAEERTQYAVSHMSNFSRFLGADLIILSWIPSKTSNLLGLLTARRFSRNSASVPSRKLPTF